MRTGLVFRSGDSRGLADSLLELTQDHDGANEMRRHAREFVSTDTIESAVEGILRAIGAESPSQEVLC